MEKHVFQLAFNTLKCKITVNFYSEPFRIAYHTLTIFSFMNADELYCISSMEGAHWWLNIKSGGN